MSRVWAIVCALLAGQQVFAQNQGGTIDFQELVRRVQSSRPSVSTSGQFAVFDAPPDGWRPTELNHVTQTNYVQLNAALTAIAGDRIRAALLQNLGDTNQWRGRVVIYLHQTRNPDEPIYSPPPPNPSTYYVSVPDKVERTRFVTAMVTVLLEEMGNRNANRPVDIPTWLAQGLAQELVHEHPYDLVAGMGPVGDLGVRSSFLIYDNNQVSPVAWARDVLRTRGPLTLDQLAWPQPGQEEDPVYRASAQLLVSELLQLDDGRQCMRAFIPELAKHLNWQVAFMAAFQPHFATRLDMEKWWELCLVRFTGRDFSETLTSADSWERLRELLRAGAQVRTSADELPLHADVRLQNVIADWAPAMQEATLKNKIQYLATLRDSVSEDVKPLVDGYREALLNYVKERDKAGLFRDKKKGEKVIGLDKAALAAVLQLDALDARRLQSQAKAALNQKTAAPSANR